jgi:hypothetical protein
MGLMFVIIPFTAVRRMETVADIGESKKEKMEADVPKDESDQQ